MNHFRTCASVPETPFPIVTSPVITIGFHGDASRMEVRKSREDKKEGFNPEQGGGGKVRVLLLHKPNGRYSGQVVLLLRNMSGTVRKE
jgi:hypothetical protein